MARSLKERYEVKRIHEVQERARKANVQVIAEHKAARLIVEAMSDEDLEKVGEIVKKLNSLKAPELPKLTAAIEQAQADLNKYTAGGPISAGWNKMKSLVGIDNPVVKVTTFADALEKGFSQIPKILKNAGVDLEGADLNRSLYQMLSKAAPTGQKSDSEMGKSPVDGKDVSDSDSSYNVPKNPTGSKSDSEFGRTSFSGKSVSDDDDDYSTPGPSENVQNEADNGKAIEGKLKTVVANLQKALSPGGIFGAFKKVPYINSAELAQELIQAPIRVFSTVSKRINAGVKASEIAPDLKASITSQGGAETKGTQKGAPTRQPAQSQPTTGATGPNAPRNSTSTGEETSQPQGGGAPDNLASTKAKLSKLLATLKGNPKGMDDLTKKLVDAGLDASKL